MTPSGWNEPTRSADVIMRVDPTGLASAMATALPQDADAQWSKGWRDADDAAAAAIADAIAEETSPTEPGAHAALGSIYRDGDLVYTASSMPIRDQEAFLPALPTDVRFLCNRGANGIDGLISSGIGAAKATGRPAWIVTGDLGLYHDMNGLAALRDSSTPVRIVVLNNDGGGIFEFLPQAEQIDRDEFEAILGTPLGIDPAKVAEVYGLRHVLVDDLGGPGGGRRGRNGAHRDPGRPPPQRRDPPADRGPRGRGAFGAQPVTSGSSAPSFSSVSASSASGRESATIPAPANRWAVRSRSRALRRATQNSPSSAASIQPTGPAYQPRSRVSSSAIA